jgi:hypothetical protein
MPPVVTNICYVRTTTVRERCSVSIACFAVPAGFPQLFGAGVAHVEKNLVSRAAGSKLLRRTATVVIGRS